MTLDSALSPPKTKSSGTPAMKESFAVSESFNTVNAPVSCVLLQGALLKGIKGEEVVERASEVRGGDQRQT